MYLQHTIVEDARRYLARHSLARQAAIAEACGVSIGSLRRAVQAVTGLRLREWRRHHLRAAAERDLSQPVSRSVKEVSAELGFASQQAFARWFRRQTGLSPSAYRARHDVTKIAAERSRREAAGTSLAVGDITNPSSARETPDNLYGAAGGDV